MTFLLLWMEDKRRIYFNTASIKEFVAYENKVTIRFYGLKREIVYEPVKWEVLE